LTLIQQSGTRSVKSGAFVALAAVCLFVMQMVFGGVALAGATAGDAAAGFSPTCAPQGDAGPEGIPVSPKPHPHGACCILHANALFFPSSGRDVANSVERSGATEAPSPQYRLGALRVASELGPLSPRAPPFSRL